MAKCAFPSSTTSRLAKPIKSTAASAVLTTFFSAVKTIHIFRTSQKKITQDVHRLHLIIVDTSSLNTTFSKVDFNQLHMIKLISTDDKRSLNTIILSIYFFKLMFTSVHVSFHRKRKYIVIKVCSISSWFEIGLIDNLLSKQQE